MPFHVVCLEPGAGNPKKHTPPPEPEPPEGFVDNTVYRYRLDEDGNKVLIGTMDAFPEGWHRSKTDWEKGFKKQKEDEAMVKPLENREELIQQAKALMQDGLSLTKAAKEVGIGTSTLSVWLKKERQAANQEPIPYILAPDHHDVAEEIACLLDRKGQDYGTENIKKFGSYGVLVRVSDKVERLINLSRKEGQVNFESVEDSWKDIAGYAILALIELREGR